MANLETLEIQIAGNAEGASQNIDSLIHSLSSLSRAVGKSVSGLMRLNAELKTLKSYGVKVPNIGKVSGAEDVKKSTEAAKKQLAEVKEMAKQTSEKIDPDWAKVGQARNDAWNKQLKEQPEDPNKLFWENHPESYYQQRAEAQLRAMERKAYAEYMRNFEAEKARLKSLGLFREEGQEAKEASKEIKDASEAVTEYKQETAKAVAPVKEMAKVSDMEAAKMAKAQAQTEKLNAETEKLKAQTAKLKEATEENVGKMDKPINKVSSAAGRLMSSIGRIFKTMMIRTAIRSMLNGAKEGLDNYYQYSQKISGAFAATMDKMKGTWGQTKNQIGAALGTALTSLLPILNAIASAAIVALNAITALFALIGGQTTYSQAQDMTAYKDAIKGAGGAAKQWLATFDELNVMTSGGGGGGGGSALGIGDMFKEVELPQWMVEWKPIIEAILAGTLGAIILPKIFEWIKKIADLLGLPSVKDTWNILKKMFGKGEGDGLEFPDPDGLDNFLKPFKDSDILDGIGDVADLLGTLKKLDWKKLLVENLPQLIQLGIELITKLLAGLDTTTKVKVDKKEFEDFKKAYNNFKKEAEEKGIKVAIAFDSGKYNEYSKKVKDINAWVASVPTKYIAIAFAPQTYEDYVRKSKAITNWAGLVETKKVIVTFDDINYAIFVARKNAIDAWCVTKPEKWITLIFIDQANVWGRLTEWLAKDETKTITLDFKQNGSGNDNGGGSIFGSDLFQKPIWELVGDNDFWSKPIWDYLSDLLNSGEKKVELNLGNVIELKDDPLFKQTVEKMLVGSINGALSEQNITTLKKMFPQIKASDIITVSNFVKLENEQRKTLVASLVKAFGSTETIKELQTMIPNLDANALLFFTGWDQFTTKQKFDFLNAVKKAFGSNEAITAARNAGINIGKLVDEGMNSKDAAIRKQAKDWNDIIEAELSNQHNIKVGAEQTALAGTCALINGTISALKPEVQPKMKSGSDTAIRDKVKSTVEGGTYTVGVGGRLKDGVTQGIQDSLNGKDYSITVSANYTELGKKIKNAVESIVATLKVKNSGNDITIGGNANGGFVYSGEIFVANENGVPEMIGRFGNHGAVANADQIVAGISRGVAEANSEQNALLAQQNALLTAILQKDSSVRLQASAALGRVASQSLNMYGAMVGV